MTGRVAAMSRLRAGGLPLTVFLAACALVGTFAEIHGTPRSVPPELGGYAIAVLAAATLHWRQRAPVAVGVVVVAASLLYHGLGYPGLAPAIALAGAVPAITALGSGVRSGVAAGVIIVAGSAVPLLPPHPTSSVWGVVGPGVLLVALAALGEATRVRRLATAEQVTALQRTAEEDARARVVEERLRIAREVHDVLAHTITIITVQAAAATDALDERPEETRAALGAVREAARSAMTELSSTLALLRTGSDPTPLAPQPGLDQLPQLVEQARGGGLAVTVARAGDHDLLPGGVELAVYRIVQEALTNSIRHSRSTAASVAITTGPDGVTVEVTDDGPALRTATAIADGHGLAGMAERVRALGGVLDAGPAPAPSAGFRIAARIPATPAATVGGAG